MLSFVNRYIGDGDGSVLESEENLVDVAVTREGETLSISFSREISTTDNRTDIALDQCLYLLLASGRVISFEERIQDFPTSLIVYQNIICFPAQGFCPGKYSDGISIVVTVSNFSKGSYSVATCKWLNL